MTKYSYWNADSDMDWQDSVGMYAEPPEAGPMMDDTADRGGLLLTRRAALDAFFYEVALAIPESDPDWLEKRKRVRQAGVAYACAAAREVVMDINRDRSGR
jgi:hypothetical protein